MPANAVVRARVNAELKEQAAAICAASGLTLSDAFRMLLMRTVAERSLPFNELVPNAKTEQALAAGRSGDLARVGTVQGLMDDLHAED